MCDLDGPHVGVYARAAGVHHHQTHSAVVRAVDDAGAGARAVHNPVK